jgi:heat shock protein 5
MKESIDARNALEGYAYNMRNQLEDEEKLAGKIDEDDAATIKAAVDEVLEWLEENTEAEKEDYEEQLKDIQAIANPIVEGLYQAEGGAEDFDDEDEDDWGEHDEL